MTRLDPGLSEWGGFITQVMNKVMQQIGLTKTFLILF